MRNSKFEIRNSKLSGLQPTAYSLQPAFTLAEMLVAVGMGVALVVAASGVFSLATQAVGSAQANTQINNRLRVLFSWLDRDFARIRLDGPLFLYPQQKDFGSGNTRIDQVCFAISGNIPSVSTGDYSAGLGIVLYGPNIATEGSLKEPYEWVLTRRGTLIVSDPGVTGADIEHSSFAELISNSAAGNAIWITAWEKPYFDYDAASGTYSFSDNDEMPTYLTGKVFSFAIVQYYMRGDADPTAMTAGTAKTFYPNEEKPAWIEFEITLRDSNNQLKEGYTSRYRVNLPSR